MTTKESPVLIEQVPCEVCLMEIPKSEAISEEASDYVVHFCGLECFEKWKAEEAKSKSPGESSA
jgi:hypothetical protein